VIPGGQLGEQGDDVQSFAGGAEHLLSQLDVV